jgi:excinuclease UvrABC nuclease subunit
MIFEPVLDIMRNEVVNSTRKAVQVKIDSESDNLPQLPAVYAIFSPAVCRYVGETDNLKQAVMAHFQVSEPEPTLRYFMQSDKIKILHYQLTHAEDAAMRRNLVQQWIRLYSPSGSEK